MYKQGKLLSTLIYILQYIDIILSFKKTFLRIIFWMFFVTYALNFGQEISIQSALTFFKSGLATR